MKPLVRIIEVEAEPPSLHNNLGDLDRLRKKLAGALEGRIPTTPYSRLAAVASVFRQAGFTGVAVVNEPPDGPELVDFLPEAPARLPAMALDLGTTHLEATLIDLLGGGIMARARLPNSQNEYGADILTRIHYAARDDEGGESHGLAELHCRIIDDVNTLSARLADIAGVRSADVRALSVAGNTAMTHFFLNLDPYHLCREPYIPVVNAPDVLRALDLGLDIHPAAPVLIMPGAGSYFGGDLIAGILATDLDRSDTTSMLIDVGTNAEVVLGNREWLIACAGAAGPALEGGVARMGMQAGPGAVERVNIDPESGRVDYSTIDGKPARGICGSGMIDLVAALYLARIIDVRGKLRTRQLPAGLAERLVEWEGNPAFRVVPAEETADGEPVLLTQIDLDALMRSKAAMYAILTTLVNQVSLKFEDLHRIFVAGAFGRHIAPQQAITLGMLPDLPPEVFRAVGNSSLAGAELILRDREARRRCLEVMGRVTYVELNVNQEFMIRFSGSRFIPHTDPDLFPSVPVFQDPE